MNKRVLAAAILLAPVVFGLLTGAKSDAIVFLAVLGSGPMLIGLITQRMKGRSGAAWWFLCLVVLFYSFPFFAASFSGVINDPGQKPLFVGLSGAILFGVMPLVVIVFTSQRRTLMREIVRILEHRIIALVKIVPLPHALKGGRAAPSFAASGSSPKSDQVF